MKTSFIVDGDREFLIFAERHLTLFGYQVYSFPDADEFLASLKMNPQLIIIGDNLGKQKTGLDYIQSARKFLPKSTIIHVAKTEDSILPAEALKAGASEFIEKNSATFVRLRTSLDLLEKESQKGAGSIFIHLKKAIIG